jgi:HEPN domain-containing protein
VSDQAPWRVSIALDPEEARAIEVAMFALLPHARWELRLPLTEDEGSPALLIDARAESLADAESETEQLYARAREEAGLPAKAALILGTLPPLLAAAPYERVLNEADSLVEEKSYEWAVVRAQTAAEMYAKRALDHIADGVVEGDQKASRLFRKVSLLDPSDQALLRALTGVAIAAEEWWESYKLHVERRNQIVHADLSVSEHLARASIDAASAFIAFLRERWENPGEYRSVQGPGPRPAP